MLSKTILIILFLLCHSGYAHPAFELKKYVVHVKPNFTQKSIKGTTEVVFSGHVESLEFPLYGLQIESVTAGNKSIPFTQSKSALRIDLSAFKDLRSILIGYHGTPVKGLVWGDTYVYTNYDPCAWMICLEDPGIRAAIEISLDIPAGMTGIANGDLVSKNRWIEARAYSSYLYGFAAGNFKSVNQNFGGIELVYLGIDQKPEDLKLKFKNTARILKFLELKSGVRLPLNSYAQILVPGNEAQEKQGFSILGTDIIDPILSDPTEDWAIAHELAHQWWGNSITCKSWDHFWLNEGLVVFMAAAYKQDHWGHAAYIREIDLARMRYQKAIDAKFDVPLTFSGEYPSLGIKRAIVYSKAALFLDALRKKIGEESFWKGIREYSVKYQLKSVESKDFQKMMEQASHKDLNEIFHRWVY